MSSSCSAVRNNKYCAGRPQRLTIVEETGGAHSVGAAALCVSELRYRAMRTTLAGVLVFIQLLEAGAEVMFQHRTVNETLHLSFSLRQELDRPTGLQLYHRGASSQTTLLSVAEGRGVRVDPGNEWRLRFSGELRSWLVNVTLSHLEPRDTGLYVWELSRRENGSDRVSLGGQRVFLLVDGQETTCRCSLSYPSLLLAISIATALLLLTLAVLAVHKCVKSRHHLGAQTLAPIYEEMTGKQQNTGTAAENNQEPPTHLEEANFPLYANPNIRQSQDNYYACPRQLALKA